MRSLVRLAACFAAFLFTVGLAGGASAQQTARPWHSQCISTSRTAEAVCTVSHRVTVQETGQTLFMFEVRTRPDVDAPDLIVTAPIGFYLPDGIRLAVDGGNAIELIVNRCDQGSCHAQQDLSEDFVTAMEDGNRLQVTFSPARNNSQTIELPLAGFKAAYASIKR